jgi:two-component system, NtrC family, response regulator
MGTGRFDTATLDLGLQPDPEGPTEGFGLLGEFLTAGPAMKVIVLTGNVDHQSWFGEPTN